MGGCLLGVAAPSAHHPRSPQVLQQLFLQGPSGLDEEASVDGLLRHLVILIVRIRVLEPAGDLLWRPQPLELVCHDAGQCPVLYQFTALRAPRPFPGRLIRQVGSIAASTAVASDFATDC